MAHEKPSKDGGPPRIKCKEKNGKIPGLSFGKGLEQTFVHAVGEGISFGAYKADGFYGINVIKQVIWVDGVSYVLHDIFGIDRSRDEKTSVNEDHSKECVICLAENRDTLALPCRHLCMCSECAKALRYQTNKCPICRSELHSLLVINLGDTPAQLP
ncbi:hypothetical protein CBR_g8893 [Chara braunii]|uniref:RING-type domain-containing protein n=1 Tax=Chara braunii TaxID=69332 RepID=A0A388KN63_CHABU|nr:hypothetical protein CBR_g8893 [Chara braunii]|eukprot:GBG71477.1 hypothetical protein CBR_g8893 [Chara braunii]